MEMKLDDEVHALIVLSSLLDNWETLIVSLDNSALNSILTTKMVKEIMLNKENKRNE